MNIKERLKITSELFEDCKNMSEIKGKAYAGNADSLANFKRNAYRLNMTKYQIWAVYFNKHIDSINNSIADNPTMPIDRSEGLKGRITDAITYLTILRCILIEDGQQVPPDFPKYLRKEHNNEK